VLWAADGTSYQPEINVAEVIPLPLNPLRPYFGVWHLDPLSVGRRKKSSSPLNDAGFALLWKCTSIAERRAMLASDTALAHRYTALCTSRAERKLEVSAAHLIFRSTDAASLPRNESCSIVKITTEGRSVVAQVTTRGQRIGYVFRRLHSWILVSEEYYGRAAMLYPRSPVFRYYQELADGPAIT
jgi:hypothetical protein